MFLLAGTLKLTGLPMEVQLFSAVGIGQWFRYVTGSLQVGGAIGLFVPALAPFAALLLAVVMVGAILTHLFVHRRRQSADADCAPGDHDRHRVSAHGTEQFVVALDRVNRLPRVRRCATMVV